VALSAAHARATRIPPRSGRRAAETRPPPSDVQRTSGSSTATSTSRSPCSTARAKARTARSCSSGDASKRGALPADAMARAGGQPTPRRGAPADRRRRPQLGTGLRPRHSTGRRRRTRDATRKRARVAANARRPLSRESGVDRAEARPRPGARPPFGSRYEVRESRFRQLRRWARSPLWSRMLRISAGPPLPPIVCGVIVSKLAACPAATSTSRSPSRSRTVPEST
jgi:hypothetical protein